MPPVSRKIWVALLAVLALSLGLRLRGILGYTGSDDGVYARVAYDVSRGEFRPGTYFDEKHPEKIIPVQVQRIGAIAPVAALFRFFGVREWVLVGTALAASSLGVLVAFFLGTILFGPSVGLLAGFLHVVCPVDVRYATVFYPDSMAASFGHIALLCLLWNGASGLRKRVGLGLLAGISFGYAWLCKESVIYLLPPFFAVACLQVARDRSVWPKWGVFVALFALFLAAEGLFYLGRTGDFWFRFLEMQRSLRLTSYDHFFEGSPYGWPTGQYTRFLLRRLFVVGPSAILFNKVLAFLPGLAALGLLYALALRRRAFLLGGLWFGVLALTFNFGSVGLDAYRPMILEARYLIPLLIPAAVMSAAFLVALRPPDLRSKSEADRERGFFGCFLSAVVIGAGLWYSTKEVGRERGAPAARAASKIVGPGDRLYTDYQTAFELEFFWRFPERTNTKEFSEMVAADIGPPAYVLLNWYRLHYSVDRHGYRPPKFAAAVPRGWQSVRKLPHGELFRVPEGLSGGEPQ